MRQFPPARIAFRNMYACGDSADAMWESCAFPTLVFLSLLALFSLGGPLGGRDTGGL